MQERQYENLGKTDKVGRGPNIPTDWIKYIIAQAIDESHKPRMLLADEILERMHQSSDINHEQLPERESVAKLISRARNHPPDPEDSPWHVVTLADYDMPAEALPVVLQVSGKLLEKGVEPLTIREAKWVARLYHVVPHIGFLYVYARHYALEEKATKITGVSSPPRIGFWGGRVDFLPDLENILSRCGLPEAYPDLETVITFIYEKPPKEAEETSKLWREKMEEFVRVAQLHISTRKSGDDDTD